MGLRILVILIIVTFIVVCFIRFNKFFWTLVVGGVGFFFVRWWLLAIPIEQLNLDFETFKVLASSAGVTSILIVIGLSFVNSRFGYIGKSTEIIYGHRVTDVKIENRKKSRNRALKLVVFSIPIAVAITTTNGIFFRGLVVFIVMAIAARVTWTVWENNHPHSEVFNLGYLEEYNFYPIWALIMIVVGTLLPLDFIRSMLLASGLSEGR